MDPWATQTVQQSGSACGVHVSIGGGSGHGVRNRWGGDEVFEQTVPGSTVFVFHVPSDWDEEQLQRHFKHCGNVTKCVVQRNNDGTPRGFGFISFEDAYGARRAIVAMDGFSTGSGKFLSVSTKKGEEQHAIPIEEFPPKGRVGVAVATSTQGVEVPRGASLFVFHLPADWSEEELHRHFIHYGSMLAITVMRKDTGESRGFGFVTYEHPDSAKRAIEGMQGFATAAGKFLKVMRKQGDEPADNVPSSAFPAESSYAPATVSTKCSATSVAGSISQEFIPLLADAVLAVKQTLMDCFIEQIAQQPTDGQHDKALNAIAAQAVQSTAELLSGSVAPQAASNGISVPLQSSTSAAQQELPKWASNKTYVHVDPEANVFVYRIPHSWTEDELANNFSSFGNIVSVTVQRHADGTSKGFGFVAYDSKKSAASAIESMNGYVVEGKQMAVQLKDSRKPY